MFHLRPQVLPSLLLSTVALLTLLPSSGQTSRAPSLQPQLSGWRRILDDWISQDPPEDPRNGGSRPADESGICWVAPFSMPETAVVWSDRPTFTWQSPEGAVTQLELTPRGDRHPPITYPISEDNRVLDTDIPTYQLTLDQALEPDVTYEWRMYRPIPSQPNPDEPIDERIPRFVRVEVLNAADRDLVAAELADFEDAQAEAGITGQQAILERADFFGRRRLLAETWRILLSEATLSADLEWAIALTLQDLCTPPSTETLESRR